MYEKRFALTQKLAPSQGTLYYYNDYTTLRIGAIPQMSPDFTERIKDYNRAELKFLCPYPFWEDLNEKQGYMAFLDEGFEFPFEFDISFATTENETALINSGPIPAPVEITIKGPASNPKVINETTGQTFSLLKELDEGETLIINTKPGNKSVTIIHSDSIIEDALCPHGIMAAEKCKH